MGNTSLSWGKHGLIRSRLEALKIYELACKQLGHGLQINTVSGVNEAEVLQ